MPADVFRLAREYMENPQEIRLNEEELSLDTIDQSYLVIHEKEKFKLLCNFIRNKNQKQTIVFFCATKQRIHRLASELKEVGFKAITMHGDLSQRQIDSAMYKFRKGFEDILVATDIATRGIDVPAVGHVTNYDIPANPLIYFNRIGSTVRAGTTGKAISVVSQDRVEEFGRILKTTEKQVHKLNEEMGIEVPSVPQYSRRDYLQRHQSNFRRYDKYSLAIEESASTTCEIKSHYTGRNKSNNRYGTHYRYL
jgi:ATP-dependent RNA helicase DeaD